MTIIKSALVLAQESNSFGRSTYAIGTNCLYRSANPIMRVLDADKADFNSQLCSSSTRLDLYGQGGVGACRTVACSCRQRAYIYTRNRTSLPEEEEHFPRSPLVVSFTFTLGDSNPEWTPKSVWTKWLTEASRSSSLQSVASVTQLSR